jgi:hypothetical protein
MKYLIIYWIWIGYTISITIEFFCLKWSPVMCFHPLSISSLEDTKSKHHTSLQTKCKILSMKRNNATTQIASSHISSCEEMKEGNCSIHVGIIILNSLSFECWTQIDLLFFGVIFFFRVPLSYTTLDFAIVWICLNYWIVGIIVVLTWKIGQIICWC